MIRRISLFLIIVACSMETVSSTILVRIGYASDTFKTVRTVRNNVTTIPVDIKQIATPNTIISIDAQERMYQYLVKEKKINVIIHTCDFNLMLASNRARIPYFLINDGSCQGLIFYPNNVMKMNFHFVKRAPATVSLLNLYRVNELIILTDFGPESTTYFPKLRGEYSRILVVNSNMTSPEISNMLLEARDKLLNDVINVLVLLKRNHTTLYKTLLDRGLFCGLLKAGTRWLLPTYVGKITDFENYRLSGGNIITMSEALAGIPPNSDTDLPTLTEIAVDFTISTYNSLGDRVSLENFKKSTLNTTYGVLAFNQTTGDIKDDAILVSVIQDRKVVSDKYVWENDILRVSNPDQTDENDWRIAVVPNTVIFNVSENGVPKGFAVDIMHQISLLNPQINYSFIFPDVQINSTTDMDAMWEVVINMLTAKKADLSFVPTPLTTKWQSLVSFSYPYFDEIGVDMLMARQNETMVQRMLWYLTSTFSFNVWMACGISFILLSFVLWITDKISPNYGGKGHFGILDSLFLVAAAFNMAKLDVKPRMLSVRIFNILLWFATLLTMASYAANLFQFILNRPPYTPVKTFQNALEFDGTFPWFWRKGLFSFEYFITKAAIQPSGLEAQMLQVANKSWPNEMYVANFSEIYPRLSGSQNILIGDSLTNKLMAMKYCNLQALGTKLNSHSSAFPFRKDWNGKDLFLTTYTTLEKLTIIGQVKQTYFNFNPCRNSFTTVVIKPMDIFDVGGIFFILGVGIVFYVIACILEQVAYKIRLTCQRKTGGGLAFGQTYKTRIVLIEPDGIWVEIIGSDHRQYFVAAHLLHPTKERNITPADLGLQIDTKMKLVYHGNDPISGERLFRRPN